MPVFRYTAIDPTGKLARGTMDAADEAALLHALRRQGHIPMRARPAARAVPLAGLLSLDLGGPVLRRQELADFTRELATMLTAGQDIDRALRFLVETAPNPRVAGTIEALRTVVRDGGSLATAMARQPRSFSRLYVGLVRAGATGGTLAPALGHLAQLLERERSLATTVRSALIYPGMLALTAIGSIALLLTKVLPQFVPLFEQNGAALPGPTRMLIGLGDLVSEYGLHALLALLALGFCVRAALRRPGLRLAADRLLLRLPVLGTLTREVLAARLSRTLGTLLVNGVQLVAALGIVRDVVGNRACEAAVERASEGAKAGAGLARPLGEAGVLPLRTIYLLRLGEETATLGPTALRAAEIHEEAVRISVQRLLALLVPAITIVMGLAVAGIVSSLLLAMLSLNDLAN